MTAPREHADDKTGQSLADVLPCPLCGSTEGFYVEEGSTSRWRVISCRNCGEGTEVRHKNNSYDPDSYIADWNAAAPYPAMLRKEIGALSAEKDRLTACLEKANASAEHFEREWYLRGDELDTLRAQLAEAQRDSERLDWMIEQRAYVVSDPDCCDGYWLRYHRKDNTLWVQATEHETPRAAIDAARGER